jgi:DNA invertase Pin-like site-specific DNA recombinase
MKVGYARVSTTGQSLEIQLEKLQEAGCDKEYIYAEKMSGKTTDNRTALEEALRNIRRGETLVVTKLDRLARSVLDLGKIVERLQAKGADLLVLDSPDINTTTPYGKLVFNILGAVGELERSLIVERTSEGRQKARNEGVKFGRKEALSEAQVRQLREEAQTFTGSKTELGKKYGISRATVYRLLPEVA